MATSKNIRAYRRLTVALTAYCVGIVAMSVLGAVFGFWQPFFQPLVASTLIAALMLIVICAVLANLKCPMCEESYFVSKEVRNRLLHASFPLRTNPCRNCGHDPFSRSCENS